MRNTGSCERDPFRYAARLGGGEKLQTPKENHVETRAASTCDITSCMATAPHACRLIAFLLDARTTRRSRGAACCLSGIPIVLFRSVLFLGNRVCASLLMSTVPEHSFTDASNKVTYGGGGIILYYSGSEASNEGDL